jgi:hypothetical protein
MNRLFTLACLTLFIGSVQAQRDLTPGGKRSSYFGKSDYKDYRFFGLQFAAGPAFLKTRIENPEINLIANGRPASYITDPAGNLGFFAEVGLAHFTQRRSKLAQAWKRVFISFYDYGLGFKMFNGVEKMDLTIQNPGNTQSTSSANSSFKNGYLYGRFSIHKNFYIGKKYFIDNGLGANVDYRLLETNKSYGLSQFGLIHNYNHPKLVVQLNYDLGFGIKLSRRSFLIPGVHLPIMSFYEWRGGCAALKWFDSNYLPIMAKVKLIYLFEKKAKGCNTPSSDEDRKRNEEYLQNN